MSIVDLASPVAEFLDGRSVACAESCTAGRISEALAAVEEASTWFAGGLVAYQDHAKRSMLQVRAASVLSAQAAAELAEGVTRLLEVDVAVATTGVAGDEPVDGVQPGVVFLGTRVGDRTTTSVHHFEGNADQVCDAAAEQALAQLVEHLSRERLRVSVARRRALDDGALLGVEVLLALLVRVVTREPPPGDLHQVQAAKELPSGLNDGPHAPRPLAPTSDCTSCQVAVSHARRPANARQRGRSPTTVARIMRRTAGK